MMGMPLPINMIFPKIQEEFKKIIESGEMAGLVVSVEKTGVAFVHDSLNILITPDMEYDEIIKKVNELKSGFNHAE
jgi:hypothetical protein